MPSLGSHRTARGRWRRNSASCVAESGEERVGAVRVITIVGSITHRAFLEGFIGIGKSKRGFETSELKLILIFYVVVRTWEFLTK